MRSRNCYLAVAAAILKIGTAVIYISAVGAQIWTKFGSVMQKDIEITGSGRDQNRK